MPADLLLSRAGALKVLLVAAHPDDETIGAGILLGRLSEVTLVTVTDGAPRRAALRPRAYADARAPYAEARRRELRAAATLAGLPPERLRMLDVVDQESAFSLVYVTRRLAQLAAALGVDVLVTHPYEGGHPDHDACAFAGRAACDLLRVQGRRPPALVEMTSYFADGHRLVTGRFLPPQCPEAVLVPTPAEIARKERMLAAYPSQNETLTPFRAGEERFRDAPRHDFTRPPHPGALWYERLGWPLNGARWRLLASQAARSLGLARAA